MEENEDINLEIDLEDDTEVPEEKPRETDEARLARLERQASQLKKKLGLEVKTVKEPESKKEETLDKMDRYFLRSEKITDADEVDLVQDFMKNTGKSVEAIVDSKAFKAMLKEMRDERNAQDATPSNSKRSMQSSRNSVDYWLAKGEMPPASEPKLRQDFVNAKIQRAKTVNTFSDNPIA